MNHTTRTNSRRAAFGLSFLIVGGVAAVNSYEHMRDVALLGHQAELLASTLPLSVDGLLVIASLAMAEDKANGRQPRGWARFAFWFGAIVSLAANIASTAVHHGDVLSIGVAAWPPIALLIAVEIMARPGRAKTVEREAIRLTPDEAVRPVAAVEQLTAAALPAPVSPAPAGMEMRPGAFGIKVAKPLPPARRPVRDIRLLTQTTN